MSKCVFLRAFEPNDYIQINKWRNNYEIQRLTCGRFRYVSSEMEKNWTQQQMLNNTSNIYLSICLNDETQEMIGYTSINDIDYANRKAHGGGIVIGEQSYRSGQYLIDTLLLIFEHVFNDLGMHRFTGSCLQEHRHSGLMMEMMGFRLEGIERESIYKMHNYHNIHKYSILAKDYYELLNNGEYNEMSIAKRLLSIKKGKRL